VRIALLEDDPDQSKLVSYWLESAGHTVSCNATGSGFLRGARRDSFDAYILDWIVPDLNGIKVLRKLRTELNDQTPAIITTVKDEERSIVRALREGADDYLVKPVRRAELVARIDAVCRRAGGSNPADVVDTTPYTIDSARHALALNDETIALTNREFELALFLFRNAGKVLSRNHILEAIWGIESDELTTRTVDTHVSRLRKKMKLGEDNGWRLSSVYQHGYRLEQLDGAPK